MKKKVHKAWIMLFGCCLLQGGSLGIIQNCRGIFYAPVIADLNFRMGAFSFYLLFFGVCSCLLLPIMGKLFSKYDIRLLLGAGSIVFSGSVIVMGLFNSLPAFYIAGALQGISSSFIMFFPAPLIISNWFKKRAGLAMGISAAFSGLAGVVGNPLGSAVIERFGWRVGYFFMGGLCFLLTVPVSVFLLRLHPEDCGCTAYGSEKTDEDLPASGQLSGVPSSTALHSTCFWLLIASGLLTSMSSGFHVHLSPFGTYAGYGVSRAALLVSLSMAGSVAAKLLLGQLHDRYSLKLSLSVGCLASLLGLALLLVPNLYVNYTGAFLFGTTMAVSTVLLPLTVKDLFGKESYKDLLPYCSMVALLGNTIMALCIGYIVDGLGSEKGYPVSFAVGCVIVILESILFVVSIRGGRRLAEKFDNQTL